ncbi:hypothetical protein POTOM_055071 [Populus tomentosa]|uniref:Protein FAR1-RELATED SEQUENCE n=1 Tax=Populus tomentosa TaxID=118781 RepID=A0A8X7Y2P0_POPTO|nr:hypothetical protein POTOM_055071 [Populus tomentosa]
MDDDEPAIEAKDLVNSYVVALEDECDECCVVEDAETPMVLDDGNRFDTVNVELFQCLNGMVEEPALGMGFTSEDDVRDFYSAYAEQTGFSIHIMQASDPAFYHAVQVDEEDRPSSVFWVDTRSRIAYDYFSDVVAFDTTYQANQCMVPSAPFTGVNHHKQSMLFGCALLANETESTFIWIFTTWLEAVSGQQPGLIITDYDSTMTRDRERFAPINPLILQVAHHEQNAKGNGACMQGNEWIQSLYMDRKLWVPVYVREVFFAGMNTDQKSGSVNSLFDGYVNARTTLQDFAEQYLGGDDGETTTYELAKFDEEQKQWTKNDRDDAILDVLSCLDVPSNSHRGKNLQYNVLYDEEIKCMVEGLASDHSFKVALNTLG